MNVSLVERTDEKGPLYLQLSEDALRYPEEMPLLLRNIAVLLTGEFFKGDCWEFEEDRFKRFQVCLKVISSLDRAFPSLIE